MFYSNIDEAYNLSITEAFQKSINNLSENTSPELKKSNETLEKFFSGDLNESSQNNISNNITNNNSLGSTIIKSKKVSFDLNNIEIDSIENFNDYEYFEHLEEKIDTLLKKNNKGLSIKEDLIDVSNTIKKKKRKIIREKMFNEGRSSGLKFELLKDINRDSIMEIILVIGIIYLFITIAKK